jgi:hypothetical protein
MNNPNAKVLEEGDVYFLYRPKVEKTEVRSLSDVERFYLVLHPRQKDKYRLLIMGEKTMPEIKGSNNISWSFVENVSKKPEGVEDELDRKEYETKTRGHRFVESVRPVGEGIYMLTTHDNHTHFVYALELPKKINEVQEAFNLKNQASYVVTVKNPKAPSPPEVGYRPREGFSFPRNLQDKFDNRKFVRVDPPEFMDHKNAQFLFIGAAEDVEKELGLKLQPQAENEATAEMFSDLGLEKELHKTEPLFTGKWV